MVVGGQASRSTCSCRREKLGLGWAGGWTTKVKKAKARKEKPNKVVSERGRGPERFIASGRLPGARANSI